MGLDVFATSSGLGALGVSWSALVIQLITFILGFFVVKKYAVKPIMKVLDDRHQKIETGLKLSEKLIKQEKELQIKVENMIYQARIDADQILADSNEEAQAIVKKAEAEANRRAELIIQEAKERINLETSRAKKELEKDILTLIGDTTEALLREKIDRRQDIELISRLLNDQNGVKS
jgi:F-type H+-transporting ATPase subunit b